MVKDIYVDLLVALRAGSQTFSVAFRSGVGTLIRTLSPIRS